MNQSLLHQPQLGNGMVLILYQCLHKHDEKLSTVVKCYLAIYLLRFVACASLQSEQHTQCTCQRVAVAHLGLGNAL